MRLTSSWETEMKQLAKVKKLLSLLSWGEGRLAEILLWTSWRADFELLRTLVEFVWS